MPREAALQPIGFADLFNHLGTDEVRYSAAAGELSGRSVLIEGFLSHAHGPGSAMLLGDQPGVCPDCAPAPAAVIALQGAPAFFQEGGERPVRVTGRLDFGFRIDDGVATMLRIEEASVEAVETVA